MILAVLAGLPLTMVRLGIDVAVTNYDPIGYMSFFGTFIAIGVGLAYLRMRPFDAPQPAADAMVSEPAQQTEGVSTLTDILEPSPLEGTLASGATPVPGSRCSPRRRRPGCTLSPAPWPVRLCPSERA